MNEPLVSVVMSVYNAENYLEEAILSILNQTYKNFEFIIINDGSTDKSLEIIEKYAKKDNRIKVISRENRGLIYSLNEGISLANGKYIARMDADDISLPNRFEKQVKFMENNLDVGVCGTWIEVFGDNFKNKIWKMPITHDELKTRLLFSVPVAHPSVMIRKDIFIKYNLIYKENYKHAEDYKLWLDFSKYTKFANIPKVLFKYRYVNTSVSRIADSQLESRYVIIKSIFFEILKELNIINTENENKLHFIIASNERISKNDIDLNLLNKYLSKLLNQNKKVKYFNQNYLTNFLTRKFLIVLYFKIKNKNYNVKFLFHKYLYVGMYYLIMGRIFEK